MSKYIENNLEKNEEVLYTAKSSFWPLLFPIIPALFLLYIRDFFFSLELGILLIIIILILFLIPWLRNMGTDLVITNKRVIAKFGIISRSSVDLLLTKVEGVTVEQSIWGRIFNYGTLNIKGASTQAPIPYISKPLNFRKKINEFIL